MNLLKSICLGICLISVALADKAPIDLKASESQKLVSTVKEIKKIVVGKDSAAKKQDEAQDRIDTLDEKSDVYEAASSNLEAGSTVSQGNLYYYYYPVAAYPVHASDKVSSSSSSSTGLLESPLVFILVPLVLLLLGAALIPFLTSNTSTSRGGRSFGRASSMDEKFGSFAELQEAIDVQLAKYMTALDSEDCMDRIVCELGTKASNIPHKNLFFR